MSARAIGSGTVSFGLVSIPVKVFSSNQATSQVKFNMLERATGARLKQQYVSADSGDVVPRSEMARGYEFSKGQFVVLTDDEYKALQEVASNAIELTEFVPADQVDPIYFEKVYYLGPDKGGERAYALLGKAMVETGLVGLAKYSARGKQYMVMVRPHLEQGEPKGLVMHQLRYSDEIKSFSEVPIADVAPSSDGEVQLAKQIINQIASKTFDPQKYRDEVKERMLELIQQKVEGQEITAPPEVAPQGHIIDLMAALKASLGESKKTKAAPRKAGKGTVSKAKATAKKTTKKKKSG